MPNWKYKLESEGKLLRQLIEEEKEPEIIEHLQVCYKRLLSKLTPKDKENFLDDIEESYNLLDGEADVIRDTPDVVVNEWEFISTGDLVDCRLRTFYDHCDDVRCWVGL